jgi:DNA-binding response OmpR family regulator
MDAALRSEGADTLLVQDGNAAVAACMGDPPDLVILDMMLPRRSGFLVLEKIKGHEDSPLVIMVTANEGRRHQAYAESLGVDKYLLKPVPLQRLIETAVQLLDKRDAEEADLDEDADEADAASEPQPRVQVPAKAARVVTPPDAAALEQATDTPSGGDDAPVDKPKRKKK